MENLIFLFASSFLFRISIPQKLRNYSIGETGCTALLLSGHEIERIKTKTGDRLYFTEFKEEKVSYGIICVDLQHSYLYEEADALLENYINKLKKPFYILHHTGLEYVTDWNNRSSIAFTDYWQDMEENDWKIKGYTNGRTMAVLYVRNIGNEDVKKIDRFLDSFHFSTATEVRSLANHQN